MDYEDIKFNPPQNVFKLYREAVKKGQPYSALVDTRESDKREELVQKEGFTTQRKQLDVGDYVFEGGTAFEYKAGDFANFADVLTKARELKQTYKYAYVAIAGDFKGFVYNRFGKREMWQILPQLTGLVSTLVAEGIPPVFASSEYFAVKTMCAIARKNLEIEPTIHSIANIRVASDTDYTKAMYVNLPGIGGQIATKLMSVYPDMDALMKADFRDLGKVDGIGRTKALKIYHLLHPSHKIIDLSSLEGFGATLEKRLIDKFGNYETLVAATLEDLVTVDGVSRKKAEELHAFLHTTK